MLAGPPGAGKGRVADTVLGADRDHYVNIDADEFKKLTAEQREWVKKGRDEEAKALISSGLTKTQAYTEATMDRILYVNNVISRSVLVRSDKGYQGLYTFAGKGMTGVLEVWWYDEDTDTRFYARGRLRQGMDGEISVGPSEEDRIVVPLDLVTHACVDRAQEWGVFS